MSNELPPQFLDENNEEICPSCAHVDACMFVELRKGLASTAMNQAVAVHPSAFNAEAVLSGPRTALERRRNVSEVTDAVDDIIIANCLQEARAANAQNKPDH